MSADRAPGVIIEFVDPPPAIAPTRVDVPVIICVAERGPLHTPVRCGSWSEFRRVFGGFVPNGLGAYAAKGFFEQGGGPGWFVRVAAPERHTSSLGAQPTDRRRSVLADLAGLVPGAAATLTQAGVRRSYLVTAADPVTATVTWDRPLHPDLDLTLGFDIATGAGTATRNLLAADGVTPALSVWASGPGSWGDRIEVALSPGRRVTTVNRPDQPGGPDVTTVLGTAGIEPGDRVRLSQDLAGTVTVVEAVVAAVDPARRTLTWTAPLPAGLDATQPFALEVATISLAVLLDGATIEVWPDLSTDPIHPRYAPALLVRSDHVRVEVLGAQPPAPGRWRLSGGRDGTAGLSVADVLGDELLTAGVPGAGLGLAAALDLDEPAVVAIPDLVAEPTPPRMVLPPPVPDPCDPCRHDVSAGMGTESVPDPIEAVVVEAGPGFAYEDIVAAQTLLIESCLRHTERIALLDPPPAPAGRSWSLTDLLAWSARFSAECAVTVAPWLTVIEPADSTAVRRIPASGHYAGLIAQCDAAVGPWLSPANRTLAWAHGLTATLSDDDHARANTVGLNLIRPLPGRSLVPMGARTLAPDPMWLFVAVRRTMIFLRRTLRHHLGWVVFEPIDTQLATLVAAQIATLLTDVYEAGGLAGTGPEEAFALAVDTSQAAVGQLSIMVGVALARPSEFVTVRVSRTDNRLDLTEEPRLVVAGGAA